jgi:hypothetical protein
VFYRRIWNIVGKYSILCCDSEAYDQRTAQAFGAESLWLAMYEFAVLLSQHCHADQHTSRCWS